MLNLRKRGNFFNLKISKVTRATTSAKDHYIPNMRVSLTTIFSSLLCTVLVSSQDLDTFDKKCVENYGVPSADPVPGSFSNDDCTDVDGTRGAIQTAVDKLGDMNIYAVTKQVVNGINYVIFVVSNGPNYMGRVYRRC